VLLFSTSSPDFARWRRRRKKRAAIAARRINTPTVTPTPIAILVPELIPGVEAASLLLGVDVPVSLAVEELLLPLLELPGEVV